MAVKRIITPQKLDMLINKLIKDLQESKLDFTAIYGIMRGGLPVAVKISHYLDVPMVRDLDHYSFEYLNKRDNRLLIVDDIVDTGTTFNEIISRCKQMKIIRYTFASIHVKPIAPVKPNYYVEETSDWIVYPWEPLDDKPSQIHLETYPEVFEHD